MNVKGNLVNLQKRKSTNTNKDYWVLEIETEDKNLVNVGCFSSTIGKALESMGQGKHVELEISQSADGKYMNVSKSIIPNIEIKKSIQTTYEESKNRQINKSVALKGAVEIVSNQTDIEYDDIPRYVTNLADKLLEWLEK